MTPKEKKIFQAKVKKAVLQVDDTDFVPYVIIDGKRFNIELLGDDDVVKVADTK